jgi:hypothetical protein
MAKIMKKKEKCQIHKIEYNSKTDYLWLFIDKLGLRRNRALKLFQERKDDSIDPSKITSILNLQPDEIVEVRSEKEIISTLEGSKYDGLSFMPEMLKHCGKQFKVLKRINRYIIEGKKSKCIRPKNTVILEGVFCDGSWHGGCDRTCYYLWREKWLKRV